MSFYHSGLREKGIVKHKKHVNKIMRCPIWNIATQKVAIDWLIWKPYLTSKKPSELHLQLLLNVSQALKNICMDSLHTGKIIHSPRHVFDLCVLRKCTESIIFVWLLQSLCSKSGQSWWLFKNMVWPWHDFSKEWFCTHIPFVYCYVCRTRFPLELTNEWFLYGISVTFLWFVH